MAKLTVIETARPIWREDVGDAIVTIYWKDGQEGTNESVNYALMAALLAFWLSARADNDTDSG